MDFLVGLLFLKLFFFSFCFCGKEEDQNFNLFQFLSGYYFVSFCFAVLVYFVCFLIWDFYFFVVLFVWDLFIFDCNFLYEREFLEQRKVGIISFYFLKYFISCDQLIVLRTTVKLSSLCLFTPHFLHCHSHLYQELKLMINTENE